MINSAILDAHGIPQLLERARQMRPGAVELPEGLSIEAAATMWCDPSGVWFQRPVLSAPALTGLTLSAAGLPAGTTITVEAMATGAQVAAATAVAGALAVILPTAGTYLVTLHAPPPWRDWQGVITA